MNSRLTPEQLRAQQGADAVLSLDAAAKLLPLSNAEARAWILANVDVRDIRGRPVVIWGDVLDALRGEATPSGQQLSGLAWR